MEDLSKIKLIKEGFNYIFKKWTSFRIALDQNPRVLTIYVEDDDEKTLEVEEMINLVYNDCAIEIEKDKGGRIAQTKVAEILHTFVDEYLGIELQDGSDEQVGKCMCMLFMEIVSNKLDYLTRLRSNDKNYNYSNYHISFPIKPEEKSKVAKLIEDNESDDDLDEVDELEDEQMQVDDESNTNVNNNNNTNQPDDDGFIVVKKGKKF
jgi:hypothetical protein